MDISGETQDVLRLVRGLRGRVQMRMELVIRFEYGTVIPWVSRVSEGVLNAVAGPDQITFSTPVPLRGEELKTRAEFVVEAGHEIPFSLTWCHSYGSDPALPNVASAVQNVTRSWQKWSSKYKQPGPWSEAVRRSLITLKALTHDKTGGIVAAATTSLPEEIGGPRNWDYRFCWL